MKVAIVHSFYSEGRPSGENTVVMDQLAQLTQAGHSVRLVARKTDDLSGVPGYLRRSAITVATGRGASPDRALQAFDPDVVHLHNTFPNWGTRWLNEWAPKVVATLHNFRPVCANGLLFRDGKECSECLTLPGIPGILHQCYRESWAASIPVAIGSSPGGGLRRIPGSAARLIALNDSAATVYERVYKRPVDVVPNFVPRRVGADIADRRGWVYIGRLGAEKGIDRLLEIWPPGRPLDIIGDGPLREDVLRRSATMPNVRVLGLLARDDVLRRLSGYVGLVLPSMSRENLPTVILEALAAGVPCVVSHHISAAPQLLLARVAESFDPSGSTAGLAASLDLVEDALPEMTEAALTLHGTEYSPEAWQARIDGIYSQVGGGSTVDLQGPP